MGNGQRQRMNPSASAAILTAVLISLPSISTGPACAQDTLRIGYSVRTLGDVNARDARAATAVLATQLARHKDLNLFVESLIYEEERAILRDLDSGFLHVISLVGREYIDLAPRVALDPVFVPVRDGSVYEQLLFLVAAKDSSRSLGSFRGKRVLASVSQNSDLSTLWLQSLARDEGVSASPLEVEHVFRASTAVLPVLFGRAEGCIVFRSAFRTMVELNPQVGRELVVWRRSPEALMSVLCLNRKAVIPGEEQLRTAVPELPYGPEGRQLLNVFGLDGHVPFEAGYLEELQELMRGYSGNSDQVP